MHSCFGAGKGGRGEELKIELNTNQSWRSCRDIERTTLPKYNTKGHFSVLKGPVHKC